MDIVETIMNAGGAFGLAIFCIWVLNEVWKDRLKDQKQVTEEVNQMRERAHESVEKSTAAIAANTEVLRANTEAMQGNTEAMTANREVTRQVLEQLRAGNTF